MKSVVDAIRKRIVARAAMLVFCDAESMVKASALMQALTPQNVYFIHIDHGLLRKNEKSIVISELKRLGAVNIISIDAESDFLIATADFDGRVIGPLSNARDPYEKRHIMGCAISQTFLRAVNDIGGDVVAVGMHGIGNEVVEIGANEVKRLSSELLLSAEITRQPFPAPALSVRVICNESVIALTTEQREALYSVVNRFGAGYASRLVPIRTVGVREGVRSYKSIALICKDGIDSDFEEVVEISRTVLDELKYINRVVLRIDSSEHAKSYHDRSLRICREAADSLRVADAIVADKLCDSKATQFFAVLVPFVHDKSKQFSVAIRAVVTDDFKTADAAIPGVHVSKEALFEAVKEIKQKLANEVDMVLYDVTSKPPAAIEWE